LYSRSPWHNLRHPLAQPRHGEAGRTISLLKCSKNIRDAWMKQFDLSSSKWSSRRVALLRLWRVSPRSGIDEGAQPQPCGWCSQSHDTLTLDARSGSATIGCCLWLMSELEDPVAAMHSRAGSSIEVKCPSVPSTPPSLE